MHTGAHLVDKQMSSGNFNGNSPHLRIGAYCVCLFLPFGFEGTGNTVDLHMSVIASTLALNQVIESKLKEKDSLVASGKARDHL
jgi:hypothetical protein